MPNGLFHSILLTADSLVDKPAAHFVLTVHMAFLQNVFCGKIGGKSIHFWSQNFVTGALSGYNS